MTLRHAMLALLLGTTALSVANGQPTAKRGNRPAAAKLAAVPLPIVTIPYEKFVLPNGLTVIVNEDHGAPVVTMTTYLHVGSANETTGRTGFAHLFEHLMFNGSEHANDDWFKFMNEIGAEDMNGSTGNDRTNYYQTVPKGAWTSCSGTSPTAWQTSCPSSTRPGSMNSARSSRMRSGNAPMIRSVRCLTHGMPRPIRSAILIAGRRSARWKILTPPASRT